MWNRLPSGVEVDLTRDQFKRGEVLGEPMPRARPAEFEPKHPRYHRYETYLILSERVRTRLGLRESWIKEAWGRQKARDRSRAFE